MNFISPHFLIISFSVFIFFSCSHEFHESSANKHMHKKSHAELIQSFSDPERDSWQKPDVVLKLIGPLEGKKIIDIGAGSGYFTEKFLNAKAQVVSADIDDHFLKHLIKSFSLKYPTQFSPKKINSSDPQMNANEFDLAFTSNTYHHIENRVEYLKKVKMGLKSTGKFIALDFKPNISNSQKIFGPPLKMRISASTAVDEMIQAGFDYIEIHETHFDHQYLIIAHKLK